MKIAYIIDYLYSLNGGTERQLFKLIQGMQEKGHEVTLYVFRHTEFTKKVSGFRCNIVFLDVDSLKSPVSWFRLFKFRRELERNGTHVLHGFFNDVALAIPLVFLGSAVITFTSRRDMGAWYTKPRLVLLRLLALLNTKIVCNCNAVAEYTHQSEKMAKTKIYVVENGIDEFSADSADKIPSVYSDELCDIKCSKIVIVANVRPIKRLEDAILAIALVKREGVSIRCHIIGDCSDSEYYKSLNKLIAREKMENEIRFVGSLSEPRSVLEKFDVGILCSYSEGLSNSIMEYLDAGLPVIASNVGGNRELVAHGSNGFLYERGDYEELAQYISLILRDQDLRIKMKNRSDRKARNLSVENMLLKQEAIYLNESYN